ncbi:MAG TPA: chemotaxis protein, partial [Desulfuromonadales bacterium]|nr:chemotaxis protein [Desulfuromonadales bacterium]
QNTANAEESAAAAEELSSQAAQLRQMLGRFRLKARPQGDSEAASLVVLPRQTLAEKQDGQAKRCA